MTTFHQIWATKSLRNKILFTIAILVIFRIVAHITLPGANMGPIQLILEGQGANSPLGALSMLTGGAMNNFSIVLMGLTPYINASIIMQLLAVIVPSLESLKKEGESGQKKINQYTRILTLPIAFAQSWMMIGLINKFSTVGVIVDMSNMELVLPMMFCATAGTVFLMWLGELITEKGIGNGISLLIFSGIVSTVPRQIGSAFQAEGFLSPIFLGLLIATVLLVIFVIYVSEGDRRVPVVYAGKKGGAGANSFLPLKINQAGMIPIIFAVSVVSAPTILANFFKDSSSESLQRFADFAALNLNPSSPTLSYNLLYAALIFGFTYFYVSIVFEPKKIADNIGKRGGFIPGYRPGVETQKFLSETTSRLCFWGGSFLTFVAIVPMLFQNWLGGGTGALSLFISGAGMIIVVSVVLDIIRRINAQLVMHDYDKL